MKKSMATSDFGDISDAEDAVGVSLRARGCQSGI